MEKRISYIKGVLIMTLRNLEEGFRDQRSERQILVPTEERLIVRLARQRFKLKSKDKPRVDLSHLAYYTLLWIACIDNMCNMHRVLKNKNQKYLTRIYQAPEEKRFRDARYIYRQHLVEV